MSPELYAGVDVGSSHTKVALLGPEKKLVGRSVKRSGTDFEASATACLKSALEGAQAVESDIIRVISTGYGRKNVPFRDDARTEIGCHARGCFHAFQRALTIIDIGGQDNKVIKIDGRGRRLNFKMNRKCAAGTGAFLQEMSLRLDVPLEEMDALARRSRNMVELGSYCTVFSATEVLEKIRQGKELPDIVKGLFYSVIKRILEMDALTGTVAMTGGVVAYNPYLVEMVMEMTGLDVLIPEFPQLTGAVGAALFALGDGTE